MTLPLPGDAPEPAIARWLAHGVTSRTHPVLRCALETFLHPLGIEAEALEAEPFSALEADWGGWWLRHPRWHSVRFDRRHPAAADFTPLLAAPDRFEVAIDPQGLMTIGLSAAGRGDPAAESFWQSGDQGWSAARHAVQAAQEAESFIYAAAGMILASDPAAETYVRGNDEEFCRAVRERMLAIRSAG
jgi:hypothetical protein